MSATEDQALLRQVSTMKQARHRRVKEWLPSSAKR